MVEQLVTQIGNLTVSDLVALTKALQEKFDVSPLSLYGQSAISVVEPEIVVEEPTAFDVVITASGDRKIQVIKRVRELTSLGLKEAKELVDNLPGTMRAATSKEDAEKLKIALEAEGAVVSLVPN